MSGCSSPLSVSQRRGLVIAEGTPEDVARVGDSSTGHYLAKVLAAHRSRKRPAASGPAELSQTA